MWTMKDYYSKIYERAKEITNTLWEERHMYVKVVLMGEKSGFKHSEDGVYIVFGYDEVEVENTAFNTYYMVEEYRRRDMEEYIFYPEAVIFKLEEDSFVEISKFCDRRNQLELIKVLFDRYHLPLPIKIYEHEYEKIEYLHYESITKVNSQEEQEEAKRKLKICLQEITDGTHEKEKEVTEKIPLIKNRIGILKSRVLREIKDADEKKYRCSVSNAVSTENDLKVTGGVYRCVNIRHEIVPFFEKEIEKYPHVFFYLNEKAKKISLEDRVTYWHELLFPIQTERKVMGIIHKYEHDLVEIAKRYTSGRKDVYGVEILEREFDLFARCAQLWDAKYFYDENSVYAHNYIDRVGIVAEKEENIAVLKDAIEAFLTEKLRFSYLDEDPGN